MFGKKTDSTQAPNEELSDDQLSDDEIITPPTAGAESADQGHRNEAKAAEQPSQSGKRKRPDKDLKPLHSEVELLPSKDKERRWKCKHCKQTFSGSYTRISRHFFGVTQDDETSTKKVSAGIVRCMELMNDRVKFESLKSRVEAAEKKGVSSQLRKSLLTKRNHPTGIPKIKDQFGMMERDDVDQTIMMFLCANGIAFNALRSPQFKDMVSAINRAPKGYKGPSYEKARTILLDETKRRVEKQLSPIQDTWHTQGVSIVSDGWTNVKNAPLINVIAENSRGAMFMYGTDFSGVEKTGVAIADFLLKSIDEVGPSNVVQVITDNASNCKLAGSEIQKVHKHIFWSPCVVHTLNLVFKGFDDSLDWLSNAYKKGKILVKFIVDHQHSLALFRSNSKLELLKVAKTRFATHFILLKRLMDCRESLVTTVCLNKWRDWIKRLDEKTRKLGDEITDFIKSDSFWDEVENCIVVLAPLYKVMRFADGEGILMGEIYEKMDNMLGELKDIMRNHK